MTSPEPMNHETLSRLAASDLRRAAEVAAGGLSRLDGPAFASETEFAGTIGIPSWALAVWGPPRLAARLGIRVPTTARAALKGPEWSIREGALHVDNAEPLRSLPSLEVPLSVGGDLDLSGRSGRTWPFLREVAGNLDLTRTCSASFPALARVGGDLRLGPSRSASLPALTFVGGTLHLSGACLFTDKEGDPLDPPFEVSPAQDVHLPLLEVVGGNLRMHGTAGVSLPALTVVGRSLDMRGVETCVDDGKDARNWTRNYTREVHIPLLASIRGNLHLSQSMGVSFPCLRTVEGSVFLGFTGRTELELDEFESGRIWLWAARDASFPRLEGIGGHLNLSEAENTSFPALRGIGGRLCLWCSQSIGLPALLSVGGNLDVHCSEHVDDDLGLYDGDATRRSHLPLLEHVGGDMDLRGLDVAGNISQDDLPVLSSLRSISGRLLLRSSCFISLPALVQVEGDVDMAENPCSHLPMLTTIGGGLDLSGGNEFDELPRLLRVGGRLLMPGAEGCKLPCLETVSGDVDLSGAARLKLGSLWTIGGALDPARPKDIPLPVLHSVGGRRRKAASHGHLLERSLNAISALGNDELDSDCAYRHIGHVAAAMVAGRPWEPILDHLPPWGEPGGKFVEKGEWDLEFVAWTPAELAWSKERLRILWARIAALREAMGPKAFRKALEADRMYWEWIEDHLSDGPAGLLEWMLDRIWSQGDHDECSIKHVGHAGAAVAVGRSWRDAVDYQSPWSGEEGDWVEAEDGQEVFRPWSEDLLAEKNRRLAMEWAAVEAFRDQVGLEAFREVIGATKFGSCIEEYIDFHWSGQGQDNAPPPTP